MTERERLAKEALSKYDDEGDDGRGGGFSDGFDDGYDAAIETMRELWKNHHATKFKSDGSHFQADLEIDAFLQFDRLTKARE
jgi:hypothetical protein